MNHPDYAARPDRPYNEDEAYHDYRERRRARALVIIAGVALAGAGLYLAAKNGHVDIDPSNRSDLPWNNDPVVAHINMQHDSLLPDLAPNDGDGLSMPRLPKWFYETFHIGGPKQAELIPAHNPGEHYTAIPIDLSKNPDPDKVLHDWLLQHPNGRADDVAVVSPPGRHVPPYKPDTGTGSGAASGSPGTGTTGTGSTEAVPYPEYQHFSVPDGGGLEDRIYRVGHALTRNFTAADAHRTELDLADRFGGHQIVLDGHTADSSLYRSGNEWRIAAKGPGQWAPGVEQALVNDVNKFASAN